MLSREMRLKRRPIGMPSAEDFELATVDVADPAPGQVLVRNIYLSAEPAMRPPSFDALSTSLPRCRRRKSPKAARCE